MPNLDTKNFLEQKVHSLISFIEAESSLSASYCDGLAGVGWLLLYLQEKSLINLAADDFFADLDVFLVDSLDQYLAERNHDLLHGALGVGLYFLKRNNHSQVEKIIDYLYINCDKSDLEIKWASWDKNSEQHVYNFGLAHGHAGILYFLGKCCKGKIGVRVCKIMINGIINFYFNNRHDDAQSSAIFPSIVKVGDYKRLMGNKGHSRLAWCYGDLGVLHTIYLLSDWLDDKELNSCVLNLLVQVSYRRDKNTVLIDDAQFCHGSSGAAIIFHNLFRLTANTSFREASSYWINETLSMKNEKDNSILGYRFNMGKFGYMPNTDLLCGIGGVLISYLFYKDMDIHNWNECVFLA